jgi:redox-sensitive bicupin YhaK (pirin superfamily)
MSTQRPIIPERSRTIGGFHVGRLLPFIHKKMVGPFIFIDHMGPEKLGPGKWIDIGMHPHVGLSTLTYLFEGVMEHRDSTGAVQQIEKGAVNWMTAGKGVTHTERTPEAFRQMEEMVFHGFQIWVALPKAFEDVEPSFFHLPEKEVPTWCHEDFNLRLVAGTWAGYTSSVPVYSPLYMVDIQVGETGGVLPFMQQTYGEWGLSVVQGGIETESFEVHPGEMLVSEGESCQFIKALPGSRLLLFGGKPLDEPCFIRWNYVASSEGRLNEASARWKAKDFPEVPGESIWIPEP